MARRAPRLLEERVLETYRKILDLLTARERRRFYLLLGLIMLMGVAQMVGVASILPFLAVLAKPETVRDQLASRPAQRAASASPRPARS